MDFEFTKKQQDVYDAVGALGKDKFAKRAREYDVRAETPIENMKDFFDAGLMGMTISEDMGGMGSGAMGTDPLLYLLAVEQTARYCLSTSHCIHIHCHGAPGRSGRHAGAAQRILGGVMSRGDMLNATAASGRTARGPLQPGHRVAARVDGGYVVNGKKNYTTLGDAVAYNILFAGIKGVPMPDGHIGLLFPKGVKGLTIEEGSWNPMGMRASYSPTLLLDNCMIGDENVLGTPGFMPRDRWQARFHLSFAAQYLGGAQGVFGLPFRIRSEARHGRGRVRNSGWARSGSAESARWLIYRAAALWQRKDIAEAEMFRCWPSTGRSRTR
jgi:alkylation response protein AidB-like acyl-CoA dehydrogenase